MNWAAIRGWTAIILLLDAAFGLWNHERFQALVPRVKIVRIALIEAGAVELNLIADSESRSLSIAEEGVQAEISAPARARPH